MAAHATARISVAGTSGSLVPSGYLATSFAEDARELGATFPTPQLIKTVRRTWALTEGTCGPATGLRALFDLLAEPLFGAFGFSIHNFSFARHQATATLHAPRGARVALLLLPWSSASSFAARDAFLLAQSTGTSWTFVLAPPFLSLVLVSTAAARRRLDFVLPVAVEGSAETPFWTMVSAASFERHNALSLSDDSLVARLIGRATLFHDRVRQDLQYGVVDALNSLGSVLSEPRQRIHLRRAGTEPPEPRAQALTLVYRILFLLFAESRELVPVGHPIYDRSYTVGALARDALRGAATGAWDSLGAMTRLARAGCRSRSLSVSPFGGRLFARTSAADLEFRTRPRSGRLQSSSRDLALAKALVALATRQGRAGRESITYRDLGVEELGAVYERLLDLPSPDSDFTDESSGDKGVHAAKRSTGHGQVRKLTGTFYTPQPLAEFIVRRTLSPLVRGATADTILGLRVVDPSMGSGACLIAACRYLATAYEHALVEEGRAAPSDFGERERAEIRRLVGSRCLAGVDRNPTAVELARLSLWLATLAQGKPLGFFDHRLRTGDSLVGAWPSDLAQLTMKAAGPERALPLFEHGAVGDALEQVANPITRLLTTDDETLADVRLKANAWNAISSSASPLEPWRRALSFWCARWFQASSGSGRPSAAESRSIIDAILGRDRLLPESRVGERLNAALETARVHRFFHWPLEFPDIFYTASGQPRASPGFDAVIGNPPWEMLRRDNGRDGTEASALLSYVRESRQFPSCRQGHLNLYQAFLDRALALARPGGRVGLVLPWGLASDDGAAALRTRLLESADVTSLVGLDNASGLFPIHRGIRFLVLNATTGRPTSEIRARFGVKTTTELENLPEVDDPLEPAYPVRLNRRTVERVGGPLMRIPDVRDPRDLVLFEALAGRFPRLGGAGGWALSFGREANATDARPWIGSRGIPVIEGKQVSPFRVTVDGSRRIERAQARRLAPGEPFHHSRLAYRDVSGVGNALTLIAAVVPPDVLTTHTLFCLKTPVALERQHFLAACFNSWVMNALVRLIMGSHVTTTLVEGLPMPTWSGDRRDRWISAAASRLASAASDLQLEARLQASVAHRFGLSDSAFSRVLETVPLIAETARVDASRYFREIAARRPAASSRDDGIRRGRP